jgi:hypothetical protein
LTLVNPRRLLAAGAILLLAPTVQALRIVDYNFTNYPGTNSGLRNPKFRTILASLQADILVTQEIQSQAGIDSILNRVLNVLEPGQWAAAPFVNGNDTDNGFFYKPSKVQFLGGRSFYPNAANLLRLVNYYRIKPVGYSSQAAELRILSQHLKAGTTFTAQRLAEAIGIRDTMNAMPSGMHAILTGDFNVYTSTEGAFQKFLESQANNTGRLYDPLNAVGTWNSFAFRYIHSQCPCLNNCPTGFGYSGGGLDDRFDMFLPTYNMNDGTGLELLVATYIPVGNDGLHYNNDINAAPVIPEGQAYADALVYASDHLPVRVDIQLPAKISVSPASVAFGTVIIGATVSQSLSITNPAVVPAEALGYSMAADPGFTAPGGSFSLAAGASPDVQSIGMDTGSPGTGAGEVHVASNDLDSSTTNVSLTGTVLDHAQASLDSLTSVLGDSLEFGTHSSEGFSDQMVHVHNLAYSSLRARLAVTAGSIMGGAGHFSIVGGFSPALVGSASQPYSIHFDVTGATPDSTYSATLTFTTSDENLPGALAQADLVVVLKARFTNPTDVTSSGPVTVTRLYPGFPSPAVAGATIRFDLARPSPIRIAVFDVAGRRVATIAQQSYPSGRYEFYWDGRGDDGRALRSGVYFVKMSGARVPTKLSRVTIIR